MVQYCNIKQILCLINHTKITYYIKTDLSFLKYFLLRFYFLKYKRIVNSSCIIIVSIWETLSMQVSNSSNMFFVFQR